MAGFAAARMALNLNDANTTRAKGQGLRKKEQGETGVRISRREKTLTGPPAEDKHYHKYSSIFQDSHTTSPITSAKEVESWSELHVAAWIAAINFGEFSEWADCFVAHVIDGHVLFKLDVDMLEEIGIANLGDRMVLMDIITQLKRRCAKPETRNIEVPGWLGCFIKMFTFDWADTSEGKEGAAIKEELMQANTSIAIAATLTWAIAWDLFFGSATACYCDSSAWERCFCGTAWDLEGRALTIFYCFCGLSAFLFMFSTIFAIIQILMVYEMSDDEEISAFFELLGNDTQLPGAFLFLGMILFCVPMATYMVSNVTMGIERGTPSADGWKLFTTEMKVQLAMSYGLVVITGIMLLYGFFYQLPALISYVYKAKLMAIEKDKYTIGFGEEDLDEATRTNLMVRE